MRFMILLSYREADAPAGPPSPEDFDEMARYDAALDEAGVLPTWESGTAPRYGEELTSADGPFAGLADVMGAFWFVEVASKEEAIAWALRAPRSPGAVLTVRRVTEEALPAAERRDG